MSGEALHKPLVFSGVQPTGNAHIGNYLGAIKNWVPMQKKMPCLFCVVDMHAITVWMDPKELAHNTREVTSAYIAAGIDPKTSILFPQSRVGAHAELAWIFNCVARIGWLDRMTQFKEKAGKNSEKMSVGLYDYPVLMAADILLYKGTHVPVGEDQRQHLELTRDIAAKFNHDFGVPNFFPMVEPLIMGPAARVMSLGDGKAKMSKSDPSDNSRINLRDSNDTIAKKIKRAKTDPDPLPDTIEALEKRPEADNLVGVFAALSDKTKEQVLKEHAGAQFSAFKPALAELTVSVMGPLRDEMARLMSDPAELDRILADGSRRAAEIAAPILAETKRIVGFLP
jgi:tryptophanyl-tRNA synthetase